MRPRDRGVIVNVGSALAFRGIPLQSAYCGAKHAVEGLHRVGHHRAEARAQQGPGLHGAAPRAQHAPVRLERQRVRRAPAAGRAGLPAGDSPAARSPSSPSTRAATCGSASPPRTRSSATGSPRGSSTGTSAGPASGASWPRRTGPLRLERLRAPGRRRRPRSARHVRRQGARPRPMVVDVDAPRAGGRRARRRNRGPGRRPAPPLTTGDASGRPSGLLGNASGQVPAQCLQDGPVGEPPAPSRRRRPPGRRRGRAGRAGPAPRPRWSPARQWPGLEDVVQPRDPVEVRSSPPPGHLVQHRARRHHPDVPLVRVHDRQDAGPAGQDLPGRPSGRRPGTAGGRVAPARRPPRSAVPRPVRERRGRCPGGDSLGRVDALPARAGADRPVASTTAVIRGRMTRTRR